MNKETTMSTTTASPLNASQVLILQTLAKFPAGLTRAQIAKKSGGSPNLDNLGPVDRALLAENGHADSLVGKGLVKAVQQEGDDTLWVVTAKGEKLAPTLKARKSHGDEDRVPADALDPVVKKFRGTRTYGIELYTDADILEVRELLGKDYSHVKVDALRNQIANRRKQGAFADPADKVRKAVQRAIREFGPDGTVAKGLLTAKQVAELNRLAGEGE